ncbi:NEW3 domain-containing protein [Chloroflexota bacterium]
MKTVRTICCLLLLLTGILAISQPAVTLAQDEEEEAPTPQVIQIKPKYDKAEITSGEKAQLETELALAGEIGDTPILVDVSVTGPKDWTVYLTQNYPKDIKIASIQLQPGFSTGQTILIHALPAYWLKPEPGEYQITLEADAEGIEKQTYVFYVVITAKYELALVPTIERYNTTATAGKDNYFSIEVQNNGSAPIGTIKLSSNKPEDWAIDFSPHMVDALPSLDFQTVDVNIKPPPRTIAGDYLIALTASGEQASAEAIQIRVTVETPTIWGWVGVGIVLAVIAGLVIIFRQFSRR